MSCSHARHTCIVKADLKTNATADAIRRCMGSQAEQESAGATSGQESSSQAPPAARLAALEREVELGLRDARSLVAIPAELAKAAEVTFPMDAFGKPKPW